MHGTDRYHKSFEFREMHTQKFWISRNAYTKVFFIINILKKLNENITVKKFREDSQMRGNCQHGDFQEIL